jgi:EmrB/QacA subfamily drug resistance transporter
MLDNAQAETPTAMTARAFWLAILVLSGLQLMVVLDGTVVIFALPRLQDQMGLSSAGSAWVVTSYALALGGLMLLGGRLGDAYGRKRMLLVGVTVFTASSLLCGLAPNAPMLLIARVLQGTGAAIASPTAMALIATTFAPGRDRNRAISIYAAMAGVGSIGGLVFGGVLTQASWRWIFLINVPLGALIIVGALKRLADTDHRRLTLDVRGAVLATAGCTALVFGALDGPTIGWTTPAILDALIGGVLLLIVFVFVEERVGNPLLPYSLFDSRDRVAAFVAIPFAGAVLTTMTFYVAQFMQNIIGYSPLVAGVASIPFTLGIGAGSAVSSKLVSVMPPRWLLGGGAGLLACGLFYGSTMDRDVHYVPTLGLLMVGIGFGVGVVLVPVTLCLLVGVSPTEIGPLAAVGQMALNLGGPMGLGVIGAIATSRTLSLGGTTGKPSAMNAHQLAALGNGYTLALFAAAICALIAGLCAAAIRYTPEQLARAQAAQEAAERG